MTDKKKFKVLVNVEGTLEIPIMAIDSDEALSLVEIMTLEDLLREEDDYNVDTDTLDVWEEGKKEEE
jgi:hypothetical protein